MSTVYVESTTRAYALNALHTAAVNYYRTMKELAQSASQERQYLENQMRPTGLGTRVLADATADLAVYESLLSTIPSVLRGDGMEFGDIDTLIEKATDPLLEVYFLLEKAS